MSNIDLQIQYPNHTNDNDLEYYHNLEIDEIQNRFKSISWRKLRVLELQINGKSTVFKVIHQGSKEFLNICLNSFSKSEAFEFKLESNIQLVFEKRELFGLMTRKNKETFLLKHASLEQATASLVAFINQDHKVLEQIWLQSKTTQIPDA